MSHVTEGQYAVYAETFPRARKAHECDACDGAIQPGHRYARVATVWDGSARTYKRCLRCQAIHEHLRGMDSYGELWPDEELNCGEEYVDHWGVEPPAEIAALAFKTGADLQGPEPAKEGA